MFSTITLPFNISKSNSHISTENMTVAAKLKIALTQSVWFFSTQPSEFQYTPQVLFGRLSNFGWQQEKIERKAVLFLGAETATKFGHSFHLVGPSPLPFIVSLVFLLGGGHLICLLSTSIRIPTHWMWVMTLAGVMISWFWEVYKEENKGCHTLEVQQGFSIGMLLFMLSEAMLFLSFFWGFFHLSLNPSVWIGNSYAPEGVEPFYWWRVPLLNTIMLLTSGLSLTLAHKLLVLDDSFKRFNHWSSRFSGLFNFNQESGAYFSHTFESPRLWTADTVLRGFVFLGFQAFEYMGSLFSMNDSVYGSVFFSLTGLHGFHVFVGAMFLLAAVAVADEERYSGHVGTSYTFNFWSHRVAYDGAAWYWHFVDIVWLLVFIIVYWWGFNS